MGAIGHVRIDFGRSGKEFYHSWQPGFPHSYNWYVMESCNTTYAVFTDGLSLEDAIQRYAASENNSKRLGVTKDDIAAVDLVIRHDGREWVSEDWTKSASFAQDHVVNEAVRLLRQTLGAQAHQPWNDDGGNVNESRTKRMAGLPAPAVPGGKQDQTQRDDR